jgi:hypothetical protein
VLLAAVATVLAFAAPAQAEPTTGPPGAAAHPVTVATPVFTVTKAAAEPTYHGCYVGQICGFDYTDCTSRIMYYQASTVHYRRTVNLSESRNRISCMVNWSGSNIIVCTQLYLGGWCYVHEAWQVISYAGLNRNNEVESLGWPG